MSQPSSEPAIENAATGSMATLVYALATSSATFGLETPLPLLGVESTGPDGAPSATGLAHVAGLSSFLASSCRSQREAGRNWFAFPPLALMGPVGVGRGCAARRVALAAGVPMAVFTASDLTGDVKQLAGRPRIPLPALAAAATRCANPIILVDLDEPIPPPAAQMLVEMIDPARNRRWLDREHEAIFDFGYASWIIQGIAPPQVLATIERVGASLAVDFGSDGEEELRRFSIAVAAAGTGDPHRARTVERILTAFGDGFRVSDRPPAAELVELALAAANAPPVHPLRSARSNRNNDGR